MRFVTGHTSFNLLGEMLIDPGPSLFGMAFKTGLIFGIDARPSEACSFAGPMGAMAVRALQGPLEHLVRVGEVELRFHILVAGETEVRLFRLQLFIHRSSMDLVAIIASHRAQLMLCSIELGKPLHLLVAFQTGVGIGFCIVPLK